MHQFGIRNTVWYVFGCTLPRTSGLSFSVLCSTKGETSAGKTPAWNAEVAKGPSILLGRWNWRVSGRGGRKGWVDTDGLEEHE